MHTNECHSLEHILGGSTHAPSIVALRPSTAVFSHNIGQEKGKRIKGREGKRWGNRGVDLGSFNDMSRAKRYA